MSDNVVIRCSEHTLVVAEFDSKGLIVSGQTYEMKFNDMIDNAPEEWFRKLSNTLSRIPKKTRKKINTVIPPNNTVFIKYLQIPDVTTKGAKEAVRFECENNIPGERNDWYCDVYQTQTDLQSKHAFGIFILKAFLDRFVDVLLRNKVQFTFFVPEVFLNNIAIRNCLSADTNHMLIHMETTSTFLSCIGHDSEYFRNIPISSHDLSKTISELQKISQDKADVLQSEFLQNINTDNCTFVTYYVKQFAQKLRQEIKKSELFYCRTFEQTPITKVILSGNRKELYKYSDLAGAVEVISIYDLLQDKIHDISNIPDEVKDNIGAFIGASICVKNNQRQILKLFTTVFLDQLQFQNHHLGYLLIAIIVTLSLLMGLKILKKDVINLDAARSSLEAKLLETDVDIERYSEVFRQEVKIKNFIKNAKSSFYSQAEWMNMFAALQNGLEELKTAWIESLEWSDESQAEDSRIIKIVAKMWIQENTDSGKAASKNIERFLASIESMNDIASVNDVKLFKLSDAILSFSFNLQLKEHSTILIK